MTVSKDAGQRGAEETRRLPGKQVRAFREYDQKSKWRQLVVPTKARKPYDNEGAKRWWS